MFIHGFKKKDIIKETKLSRYLVNKKLKESLEFLKKVLKEEYL